uniref:Uncharacterized protein n=1 Tax=Ascaris lumbricoides TaxID=6252 RepID=A0A9J2PR31_ASCLU
MATNREMIDRSLPKVTHIIFDLDGLLIDTEPLFVEVNKRVMAKYGKKYTTDLKILTMGMTLNPGIELLLEKVGLTGKVSVKDYAAEYDALLPELLPDCLMMPGAMRFARYLAANNIPRAICTGSSDSECKVKLRNHKELTDLIPMIVFGDDPEIHRGKPAPDCFLATMNRFDPKPESPANVVVFEDSQNGIRAAVAAGMQTVMIPDARFSSTPPDDVKDRITMVLRSFDDLNPESFGLPPYDCDVNNNKI